MVKNLERHLINCYGHLDTFKAFTHLQERHDDCVLWNSKHHWDTQGFCLFPVVDLSPQGRILCVLLATRSFQKTIERLRKLFFSHSFAFVLSSPAKFHILRSSLSPQSIFHSHPIAFQVHTFYPPSLFIMSHSKKGSIHSVRGRMLLPEVGPIGEISNDDPSQRHGGFDVLVTRNLVFPLVAPL